VSAIELLRHDVLLVFGAPCRLYLLVGQEHGRTIPLAERHSDIWASKACLVVNGDKCPANEID
jgi:hypothetical protein